MKTFFLLWSAIFIPLACSNKESQKDIVATEMVASASVEDVPSDKVAPSSKEIAFPSQKIIKTGYLVFETDNLEKKQEEIFSVLKKHQAYIQNQNEGKDHNRFYKNLVIRVPISSFDTCFLDLSKNIAFFDRKEISADDVTEDFIDTEARIKSKKMLEQRYLELLAKASKVQDVIAIEKELNTIREEIEAKEGHLNYLKNKTKYSTITIEYYIKLANEEGATVSYGTKMWKALKSGFNGISTLFIGLLHIWPLILILVALFLFMRKKLFNNSKKL